MEAPRAVFGVVLSLGLLSGSVLAADRDIVATAKAAGSFGILLKAVEAAGLTETLSHQGPFTVFAPTDEAFKALPKGTIEALFADKAKLTSILTYHVVAGHVLSHEVVKLSEAKTLQGESVKIRVTKKGVKIDSARVVKADIHCLNGVIHVIDKVLIPGLAPSTPDLVATAKAAGSFNILLKAVEAAGLTETLSSKGPFTVFAPTDEAFKALPKGTIEALLADKAKLTSILTYHVVAGSVPASEVVKLNRAKTLQGESVQVLVTDKGVQIDGARVLKTDIKCANGLIHVIDKVILPGQIEVAEYFPLESSAELRYRKRVSYGRLIPEKSELLVRKPKLTRDRLMVKDSEGEYQEFLAGAEGPAMSEQSMQAQGFTQRYEPALVMFPGRTGIGQEQVFKSWIEHDAGRRVTNGAVERRVKLLGREAVTTPAGRFEDCLKFQVVSYNRPEIGGTFLAQTEEIVWLARGLGEVKSVSKVKLGNGMLNFMNATLTIELESVPESQSPKSEPSPRRLMF